jgi:hypothetical protein
MSKDKFAHCSLKTINIATEWADKNPEHPLAKVYESASQYLGAVLEAAQDEPIDRNFAVTGLGVDSLDYRLDAEIAAYKARDIVVRAVIKHIKKAKDNENKR